MGNFKSRKGRLKLDSSDNSKPLYHGPRPSLGSHEVKLVNEGVSHITTTFKPCLKNREQKLENWAFSPFTLSSCFSMIKVGTIGQTSAELDKAFNFPLDAGSHCKGHGEIFKSFAPIQSTKEFAIISVHRIYLDRKFNITESYKFLLADTFNTSIQHLDFSLSLSSSPSPSSAAMALASYMNEWMEESTQGKIKDIISSQDLSSTAQQRPRLILLSGVYFIGLWEREFERSEPLNFYLSDKPGDFIQVEMMVRGGTFQTFVDVAHLQDSELDTDVIALPYIGQRYWMLIFLPRSRRNGLEKIEHNMKGLPKPSSIFQEIKRDLYSTLTLPKFEIECTLDLVESLLKLGVKKLFGGSESFTGPGTGVDKDTSTDSLLVSKALQKVLITVDKRGTEPSRLTPIVITPDEKLRVKEKDPPRVNFASPEKMKLEQKKYPEIIVNHPFYFQIIDKDFDMVLFAGCCLRPPALALTISPPIRKMSTTSRKSGGSRKNKM